MIRRIASGPLNARAERFPLFDSLRAIAALSVIGVHGAVTAGIYNDSTLRQFVSHLDVGVQIFFVISGFLLYRPFARARLEGADRPATGPYAWRRFLRIVPAYWVALTVIAWVQLDHAEVFTALGHPALLRLPPGLRPRHPVQGHPAGLDPVRRGRLLRGAAAVGAADAARPRRDRRARGCGPS